MLTKVLLCSAGLGLASLFGSVIGLFVKRIPHKWNDVFIGFCAGMMLTAALVCLILPAITLTGVSGWWQVALGVAGGVILISILDYITPHLHNLSGLDSETHRNNKSVNRVLLFVIAIAIHKFPEGLATGVVFDESTISNAYAVSLTIGLQNIPEGLVVVTPLLMIGIGYWRTLLISLAIAFLEMAGVICGYMLGGISNILLPALLGLAGGAMLYVISDEMIPETHAHGFEKPASYALIAGVMVMLLIDSII